MRLVGLVEYEGEVIGLFEFANWHGDQEWLIADGSQAVHGPHLKIDIAWKALEAAFVSVTAHVVLHCTCG